MLSLLFSLIKFDNESLFILKFSFKSSFSCWCSNRSAWRVFINSFSPFCFWSVVDFFFANTGFKLLECRIFWDAEPMCSLTLTTDWLLAVSPLDWFLVTYDLTFLWDILGTLMLNNKLIRYFGVALSLLKLKMAPVLPLFSFNYFWPSDLSLWLWSFDL